MGLLKYDGPLGGGPWATDPPLARRYEPSAAEARGAEWAYAIACALYARRAELKQRTDAPARRAVSLLRCVVVANHDENFAFVGYSVNATLVADYRPEHWADVWAAL